MKPTTRRLGSAGLSVATVATLALLASPARAEAKRAFTLEDFYRVKVVADPAIAPDGKWVVYSVAATDLRAGKRTINLWRVDADGRDARRLTSAEARDESPSISPDGKWIAFVSSRSGDGQLWLLPTGGGEPEKKTDFPGGVSGPVWSPDGRRVALSADVYPECGADAACNRGRDEAREKGALKAHLADRLLYRHWNAWKDGKRSHVLVLDLGKEKPELRDVTPGDFDAPVFSTEGPPDYAFSPDGKELAFTSNHDPDEASSTNADIWTVAVEGTAEQRAAPRNLTAANRAWDGQPRYSPDGRVIAYRTQRVPGYESDRFRLALYDRAAGTSRVLTDGFDDWITDFAWAPDSRRLLFLADVKGRTPLHELDLARGAVREVSAVGQVDAFDVAPGGGFAVVARRQVSAPTELYRIGLGPAKGDSRLTTHNAALAAEVDIRPAEEMFVEGAEGKKVQVFVIKPHGFDPTKRYPLILNIHGGPQQQWTDSFRGDWQVYPGAGYVVAFANPRGSTGWGQDYTAAISGDWDGKVMDDLARVTDALAALPFVDSERMGAMGWSWGGYAIMWLEGHTTRFKALASMMGVYDLRAMFSSTEELWFPRWDLKGAPWENPELYRRLSPSESVTAFKTPCLVITGQRDFRVPYTQSLEFFTDLQERKVPSRLIVFERAGHWPDPIEMALYYAAHLDWFHRYLGGSPSPWDPRDLAGNRVFVKEAPKDAKD